MKFVKKKILFSEKRGIELMKERARRVNEECGRAIRKRIWKEGYFALVFMKEGQMVKLIIFFSKINGRI